QQQSALQHAGGDAGIADGAQQDGVVLADRGQILIGEGVAGGVPAAGAEVELGALDRQVGAGQGGVEDFQAFCGDFRADSVSADDGECDAACHSPHVSPQYQYMDISAQYLNTGGAASCCVVHCRSRVTVSTRPQRGSRTRIVSRTTALRELNCSPTWASSSVKNFSCTRRQCARVRPPSPPAAAYAASTAARVCTRHLPRRSAPRARRSSGPRSRSSRRDTSPEDYATNCRTSRPTHSTAHPAPEA